jgi:drug/metabolite transporter (DMT)-like permease
MSTYALLGLSIVALAFWIFGTWGRGVFRSQTPPIQRWAYAVRVAFWAISILLVSWPLQLYRSSIGNVAYVLAAIAILALFFWLGSVATNFLLNRSQARLISGVSAHEQTSKLAVDFTPTSGVYAHGVIYYGAAHARVTTVLSVWRPL